VTEAGLYMATHCAALTMPVAAAGNGTARFYAENIGPPPPIVDGHMVVPVEPGLGFDPVDWWMSGRTHREPLQEPEHL
jgi:L-alanine-DL-glutamate epimerase-like enolase superfamily enzyme